MIDIRTENCRHNKVPRDINDVQANVSPLLGMASLSTNIVVYIQRTRENYICERPEYSKTQGHSHTPPWSFKKKDLFDILSAGLFISWWDESNREIKHNIILSLRFRQRLITAFGTTTINGLTTSRRTQINYDTI